MTVSIDIDLDALGAKMEIANLKVMLESLGDDIDVDLDLDGDLGDTLDKITDTMDNLGESFNNDLSDNLDRLENLELDNIRLIGDGDSGGDTGSDSGDGSVQDILRSFRKDRKEFNNAFDLSTNRFHTGDGDVFEDDNYLQGGKSNRDILNKASRMGGVGTYRDLLHNTGTAHWTGDYDFDSGFGDSGPAPNMGSLFDAFDRSPNEVRGRMGFSSDTSWSEIVSKDKPRLLSRINEKYAKFRKHTEGLSDRFRNLIPNMQMWWSLIAAAIPALGAMAVQALGVASAMGAIGVAGASMLGLGLIGHGDSMAESFRNAGKEIDELGKSLFDTFEPTADLFSGIQAEFFDFIPEAMEPVARSMEGFTVFEDDLFAGFEGAMNLIADLFDVMVENEGIISNLAMEFGSIIATNLVAFFEWLLVTTSENKQMLIELGGIFKTLALAIYEVFMMISRALIMLEPFFTVLGWLAKLLNNSLVSGMTAIIVSLFIINSVVGMVTGSLTLLATLLGTRMIPLFSAMFVRMSTWTFQTLAQTMANYGLAASIANVTAALATLMAMTGVGLLLAGGGLAIGKATGLIGGSPGGSGGVGSSGSLEGFGGGGGDTTVINEGDTVNVDIGKADNASMEKFQDMRSGGGSRGPTGGSYTGN